MSDLKYDIIIIGAGVSGCAVARELSRYDLKSVCWIRKVVSVRGRVRRTVELFMQDMMQSQIH